MSLFLFHHMHTHSRDVCVCVCVIQNVNCWSEIFPQSIIEALNANEIIFRCYWLANSVLLVCVCCVYCVLI